MQIKKKKMETKNELEKFYEKPFKFSYSSLNKLLYSPQSFYSWYIMKEKEDSFESHLIEGKIIHCLLLEEGNFDKYFTILPGNVPTATTKKVVESMYRAWKNEEQPNPTNTLKDYSQKILEWLQIDNTYQNLKDDKKMSDPGAKTGDQKRLDKVITLESENYFAYLKASADKDVIDADMYDKCANAVDIIRTNQQVMDLLSLKSSDFELIEVHNEIMMDMELEDYPFGLKGIIDNLVIDYAEKLIYINDIKTTSKSIADFKDSVEYYKYWMQGAIYWQLVINFGKKNIKDFSEEWKIHLHFIVIDKQTNVYPFPVSIESLLDWQTRLKEVLKIAKYHYNKKEYNLPYEFALGQVKL